MGQGGQGRRPQAGLIRATVRYSITSRYAKHMSQSSEPPDQQGQPSVSPSARSRGATVNRVDLTEAVYRKVGLSRAESARLVELVIKEITDCLERGETVKLSAFGSFVVRSKGPRMGRNPKTGVEVPIIPRRVMVFKPSDILRKRLASGDETSD
jgi:integration host factor subunit alpha